MYNIDTMGSLERGDLNDFIRAYRESLQAQRDSSFKQLNQARKAAQTTLMSNANRVGVMYSNFPQRDKIKYDTQTYMPAYTKAQQSYQTALDSLRNNAINLWNNVQAYKEAAEDYDSNIL